MELSFWVPMVRLKESIDFKSYAPAIVNINHWTLLTITPEGMKLVIKMET